MKGIKNKLPWIFIYSLIAVLAYGLILAITGFDGAVFVWFGLIALIPPLVAEIIGIVLRFVKGFRRADCIAVLITDVALLAVIVPYAINDMTNSVGFLAGLAGFLMLIFMVPALGASLLADGFVLLRRKKAEKNSSDT